jgi:hypothetical protein
VSDVTASALSRIKLTTKSATSGLAKANGRGALGGARHDGRGTRGKHGPIGNPDDENPLAVRPGSNLAPQNWIVPYGPHAAASAVHGDRGSI